MVATRKVTFLANYPNSWPETALYEAVGVVSAFRTDDISAAKSHNVLVESLLLVNAVLMAATLRYFSKSGTRYVNSPLRMLSVV